MISIFKNQFDTLHIKQRFTIKKLSIGVVSVLVGFTFCGLNGQSVSADSTLETDSTSTVVSVNPTVDEKEYTSIPVSDMKGNARSVSVTSEIDNTSFNDSTNVIKLDTKDEAVVGIQPDGSTDEATIPVIIANKTQAETNNPVGNKLTIKVNGKLPDASNLIQNKPSMPKDTTYQYKTPIDTTTPGVKQVVVVVTYPDGSSDEVSVELTVQSHAETQEPIGQNQTVKLGANPDPRELIANSIALPKDTTYQYKTPIDTTTPGVKQVVVVVTYPDGSSDEVSVELTVQSHAETQEPIGQNQTVKLGANPDPRELIANSIALPKDTTYQYKTPIDTTTPGVKQVVVVVTYPDGSSDEVSVELTVQSHAETQEPIGQNQTVKLGANPDPRELIANSIALPKDTTYQYKTPIDTTTPGVKQVVVVVTYPDGSSDEVSVELTVQSHAETQEPIGQNQTVKLGANPDPRELIANSIALPKDTTYQYKTPIDTTTPGVKQVVVVVTYPDGSSDEVSVELTVQSHAETQEPIGQNQTVKLGANPDPRELIANSIALPKDTTYQYKTPIDTTTPGVKQVVVVVTYPDGSSDEVSVQLTVQSHAETQEPIGQNQTVKLGANPDPRELIANSIALPKDTTYQYKTPIDTTTPGVKQVVVVVTYPDGSSDEVSVELTVQSHAETQEPIGQNQTVKLGANPDPRELIANSIALPKDTTYQYKTPIDTTTPGVKQVVVVVTYPDGSSDEVSVELTVQSHAETQEPIGQNQTVKLGANPDPRELIANSIALPKDTTYQYKTPIDTTTPGVKQVVVVVTYPDGSSDEVSVELTVQSHAETQEPIGQNQTVKLGANPDPRELIANSIALPKDTTYQYKTPIDTTTPGVKQVVVVVTYPDGSSDEVSVELTVQSHAETQEPIGQNQTVKLGANPDPRELIANSIALPKDTTYQYKTPIDTTTPGVKQVVVVVTYPDGSSDEVSVELTVQSHAETQEPIGQNQTVKLGANPDPRELIANSIALPKDTTYQYKTPIDTTTPGVKQVVVVVTYPDGSSDEVSVQLTVQSHAETQEPIGQNQTVKLGANPDPRELIANSIALPKDTTYQYKTPIDTTTPGVKQVVVVVTYPDGSSDEVSVELTVQSHAETQEPIGQNQTVKLGANPDPRELIANSIALPKDTTYQYKTPIDTTTPGVKQVVVVVTYPDGSSDEVSVQLTVQSHAETQEPIGQNQTVKLGANPDPRELIANSIALPKDTTYQYKTPIDTTTPGVKQVVVVVTYPDGSSDEVSVELTVQSHAETQEPIGQNQTVKLGANPDPRELIANSIALPKDTTYQYKTPIDTTTPGVKQVVVVVTYPDGSSDEVSVQLTVQSHAETQEPIGQNQTVKLGANPDPRELIANSIALPKDTTYQYKTPIDTTTPGVKQVVVVVTYPDGSSDEVSVELTVQSHAETQEPIGQNQTVKLGANPDPRELIANSIALPKDTTYQYKTPIDTTTPGVKQVVVVVTYPDGSSDEVSVQLTVQSHAETQEPIGQNQTVKLGANPDPRELIANSIALPKDTTYQYKTPIDTTTPGVKQVVVVVTYPDGSSDEVSVELTVQSHAETQEPIGQNQTVKLGANPDPRELIANSIALPKDTTYQYKTPIDTTTPGVKQVVVVVTYPDGSSDEVSVELTVQSHAETQEPIGQNQTVKLGANPDPRELIANSIALPKDTTYQYKTPIDTTTPGVKQVVVVVTYPDGSSDEVSVELTVQSHAETQEPIGQNQTVKLGANPDPRELIANSIALPKDTTYQYKTPIDTTTPGVKQVVVVVTYPDGSSDEVSVQLTVQSHAETQEPIGQNQTVQAGKLPEASDCITNFTDLPDGTQAEFKAPVDTSAPSIKEATVVITYPDGSTAEVTVTVIVKANPTQAETNKPLGQDQTVQTGKLPEASGCITNFTDLPDGTQAEFKAPVDTSAPGIKEATVIIIYPDSSTAEVTVTIIVKANPTQAETNKPLGQDQTVQAGKLPEASDCITNFTDLPDGTQAEFKAPVDTSAPGIKEATVIIIYPDSSTTEVTVTIIVKANPIQAETSTLNQSVLKGESSINNISNFSVQTTNLKEKSLDYQSLVDINQTTDLPSAGAKKHNSNSIFRILSISTLIGLSMAKLRRNKA